MADYIVATIFAVSLALVVIILLTRSYRVSYVCCLITLVLWIIMVLLLPFAEATNG